MGLVTVRGRFKSQSSGRRQRFSHQNDAVSSKHQRVEVFLVQGRHFCPFNYIFVAQPSPSSYCSSVAPLAGEDGSPEEEGEEGVTRRTKGQGSFPQQILILPDMYHPHSNFTKNILTGLGADMLKEMRVKQEKRASVIPLPRCMLVMMML